MEQIDASPTKEFFISMLIKDINLSRAIIDLVDNSIDGARRLRKDNNYDGLFVNLTLSSEKFTIEDNCGGITIEVAKNYAFRFGRPSDAIPTVRSIGQFGVGMKRTIFKLGNKFLIESTTPKSHFIVEQNIEEWKKKKEWNFEFKEINEELNLPDETGGTKIEVTELFRHVAEDLSDNFFINNLSQELKQAHLTNISQGIVIKVNGEPIKPVNFRLLKSKDINIGYKHQSQTVQKFPVQVSIYTGISDPKPQDAGWYIFCNGRLVLASDRSKITGWEEVESQKIPQYHNDFARFRGFVFFEADNASVLPWNTTKTGVDKDSVIYRITREKMIKMMSPVLKYLRRASESSLRDQYEDIFKNAELVNLLEPDIDLPEQIFSGTVLRTEKKRTGRILYYRDVAEIEKAKELLGVSTNTSVGEKTFEFFLQVQESSEI
jgi:hypothetical protein